MSDSDNLEEAKTGLLKEELVDYELDQEDIDLLDLDLADSPESGFTALLRFLPLLVGRTWVSQLWLTGFSADVKR